MKTLGSIKVSTKKPFGSSTLPFSGKTVSVKKAKKPPTKRSEELDLQEIHPDDLLDDDEEEEVQQPSVVTARAIALSQSSKLGIPDFEVTDPTEKEEFLSEALDEDNRYDNIRKNDEKLIAPTRLVGASNAKVKGIVTMFGQRSDTILRLLEDSDETDGALTLIHRTLLQTMVDVLPVVERAVRRSKGRRGLIPMNQLVSQIRELVTDIQSLRDKGQLGASIVDRVVRPAYLDIASQIALAFLEIENSAKNRMNPEEFKSYRDDVLMTTKKNLAHYIQNQYESIKSDVVNSLS